MFLLNHKVEMLVLISVIGILLPQVCIQPAQGLSCYACDPCRDDTLGAIKGCQFMDKYCTWGEREYEDGTRIGIRNCAGPTVVERSGYNCETFQPELKYSLFGGSSRTGANVRICHCMGSLCNTNQIAEGSSGGGLECYSCENCGNSTGVIRGCRPMDKYCIWGEREHADGTLMGFKGCADAKLVEKSGFTCEEFQAERKSSFLPGSYRRGDKIKMCSCEGNLCNSPEGQASGRNALIAENATSSFTSPQPLVVAVSVCVSGFLVTK